jgi:hypothetical protein
MKESVTNIVFLTENGLYEAYDIDQQRGKIGGYMLFPVHGESNPYREFDLTKINIKELHK